MSAPTTDNMTDAEIDQLLSQMEKAREPGPILTCLADIAPREVSWLWPHRFPLGRISLLVGKPGEGKSFCTTDIAARVSTGAPWPDGRGNAPLGSVLFVCAEDDPADTIRPRLDAHHADVNRIHLLSAIRRVTTDEMGCRESSVVSFTLADVDAMSSALRRIEDCRLVIVDPIGSFLGGRTDAHRDNEVRAVLAPFNRALEKSGAAGIIVAHRRKSAAESADDTAMGSRAFTGIARAVWHLSRDSSDKTRRLLLPGKNNLAPEQDGLAFTITGEPAAIAWERDGVKMNADDAMADERDGEGGSRNEAAEWLADALGDMEEHPVADLKSKAKADGLSWRTIQRASNAVGVMRHRATFGGGMIWRLPRPGHTCQRGTYEESGTNGKYGHE